MVAHCGGSHGDDKETRVPSGSSSSSSASAGRGGGNGVAEQALKKGPWTAAEDAILIEYVKKHGEGNWNAVQRNTSLNRCGKSCRLRWTNHLRPNLKKGSFSPEEERLILQLHAQLGNKWARMATQLPGRTDNEIKNYWNTRIKRRIRQGLSLYPNGIAPQKQLASSLVQPELQSVPGAATRGRPPLQIPTRTISQVLAQSHSPNPTLSPVPLSPQSYNHLKTTFANSSYSTAPLSPSTGGLASPYSPTILSPTPILNRYSDPDAPFPGFSAAHQTSSPLTLPTASSFQFSTLNFNVNSLQGLQTPQQSPSTVYIPPKPLELPSNQLLSFQAEDLATVPKPERETRSKPSTPPSSSIALLEDILEQAETLTSNKNLPGQSNLFNQQNDKFDFPSKSGYAWNAAVGSDISCAGSGFVIKNEVREEDNGQLVRLLQSIPSPANIPDELNHLGDNLNIPPLDLGLGEAATEDSLGLDMQQLALLFQADPASCPWNSMPKIL